MSAVEPNGRDEQRDPANRSNATNPASPTSPTTPASQSSHNSARASETAATVQASKYDVIVDLPDGVGWILGIRERLEQLAEFARAVLVTSREAVEETSALVGSHRKRCVEEVNEHVVLR